jgi:hypothetical protein
MIFSLAILPIILSLDSQLNIWHLDYGTLADYPEVVLSDFKKVINLSREIGLELQLQQMRDLLLFWRHRFKSHKGISKFSTRY